MDHARFNKVLKNKLNGGIIKIGIHSHSNEVQQ
jgi:hypothetical protein